MSRKKAKDKYNWKAVQKDLEKKGVRVLSAGADEVPVVYKDIEDVRKRELPERDIVMVLFEVSKTILAFPHSACQIAIPIPSAGRRQMF
jgi:RNA-splicing ligase RtcB